MSKAYTFFVPGDPRTKGSKSLMRTKNGRYVMVEASANKLKKWMNKIGDIAKGAFDEPLNGAIRLDCVFQFNKPKTVKNRDLPHVRPDLDKLLRAVNDALTGIAFKDDGQVTTIISMKAYTQGQCGCLITVRHDELSIIQ